MTREPLDTADLTALARVLCETAVARSGVSGAGLAVLGPVDALGGHKGLVHATDRVVERLEDVTVVVGDGPAERAHRSGRPAGIDDVDVPGPWALFGSEAAAVGACAVFCFPARAGEVGPGLLFCYRDRPGPLAPEARSVLGTLADVAGHLLAVHLARAVRDGRAPPVADRYTVVHTAAGMLSERWALGAGDCLTRIRAEALTRRRTVVDVARAIVERRLALDP